MLPDGGWNLTAAEQAQAKCPSQLRDPGDASTPQNLSAELGKIAPDGNISINSSTPLQLSLAADLCI